VPRLVNRIDKETSGLILCGKTAKMTGKLGKALEDKEVVKDYLALVEGVVEADHRHIDLPIGKDTDAEVTMLRRVDTDAGQHAHTEVWTVERFGRFSLVRCRLHTGRMHQIRVHMKADRASAGVRPPLRGARRAARVRRGRPRSAADAHRESVRLFATATSDSRRHRAHPRAWTPPSATSTRRMAARASRVPRGEGDAADPGALRAAQPLPEVHAPGHVATLIELTAGLPGGHGRVQLKRLREA
jgi:hypothetical protein